MKNLINEIDSCIKDFITDKKDNLELQEAKSIINLIENSIFAPGKRFRPLFCVASYLNFGGEYNQEIIKLASALELLHSFALIHDDIMDNSDLRRGKPTIHVVAQSKGIGILAGDVTLVLADQLFNSAASTFDSTTCKKLLSSYNDTKLNLCLGQYLDILEENTVTSSEEKLFLMRHYKTGKYTIESPMHIGMIAAGVTDPDKYEQVSEFAKYLGEAFQVRDDIGGTFANEEDIGKPIGSDILSNKKTYIWQLLYLSETKFLIDTIDIKDEIKEYYSKTELSDNDVKKVQELLITAGVKDACENYIDAEYIQAKKIINSLNFNDDLQELAHMCAYRNN